MADDSGMLKKTAGGVATNFLYDVLKATLGGSVVALGTALWQYLKHRSMDWWGFLGLGFFVCVVIVALRYLHRTTGRSNESLEKSIEEILVRRGIAPDEVRQSPMEPPTVEAKTPPAKLDGEIYRIVRADKNPYSDLTRQLWESANPGREFVVDIDILVEMYIVNTSSEVQYIRDFCASVEIDGARVPLVREQDFSAFDILDEQWEYCLDPTPSEAPIIMDARSETLIPLFASLPTSLAPSQPAEGWVRFLLKGRDPRKLEENRTYIFTLKDSRGLEYQIGRSAHQPRISPVKSRRKRG